MEINFFQGAKNRTKQNCPTMSSHGLSPEIEKKKKGKKTGQTQGYVGVGTKRLGFDDVDSQMAKLQQPGSSVSLLYTVKHGAQLVA